MSAKHPVMKDRIDLVLRTIISPNVKGQTGRANDLICVDWLDAVFMTW